MINETTVEQRLTSLEQTVDDLQKKVESKPGSENWLEKLIGSISDEAAFLEALEYGRILGQTDKPTDEDDVQS